ncbi:MAG: bifunctional 5,10-methylenetetrahydrofolate dehydrogenase/5,10-methenyltetrahydrofolate cyclohydrolase [Chitinophagales bacterium]
MLIYGKEISQQMRTEFTEWCGSQDIELVLLQAGDDPGSRSYITGIRNYLKDSSVTVNLVQLDADVSMEKALQAVEDLNRNPRVKGVMMLRPWPAGVDESALMEALSPSKDVEGIHPINLGRLLKGQKSVLPATPKSAVNILKHHNIPISGRPICVVGRSYNVGLPLALMLIKENATVTICHSKTKNLADITRSAEIVVLAVGKAGFLTADMINENAVVVDVGTNINEAGKLVGDAAPEALEKAAIATAVPGGVGSLTVATLMDNLRMLCSK